MPFGLFAKPKEPIAARGALEDFLDGNAAYVVQRCLYEYARGAAAYNWQPLMEEQIFRTAMERSRWLAYPIGLAIVAETVEGVLRPAAGERAPRMLEGLEISCARVMDRHRPPAEVEPAAWTEARSTLAHRLSRLQAAAPKPVKDIPKPIAKEFFALIPIVEQFRGKDPIMATNNLTMSLIAIHEEFSARADRRALADALAGAG